MKLDSNKLAFAFGGTAIVLWIICSALVALLAGPMMSMTGHMLHANMEGLSWTLTLVGFFVGLISWTVWAALAGWLVAWLYNRV